MDWMFASCPNSPVETLNSKEVIFGFRLFGRQLGLNELPRVGSPWYGSVLIRRGDEWMSFTLSLSSFVRIQWEAATYKPQRAPSLNLIPLAPDHRLSAFIARRNKFLSFIPHSPQHFVMTDWVETKGNKLLYIPCSIFLLCFSAKLEELYHLIILRSVGTQL